ncbi:TPA: DNA phosphorothioation-dependent restriction protein DptG [Bacillus cereus]|uniref:DNA phosphorothioation-dependent restriction protein DptG n=1 Tax=Bacillus cereus TaxID=1396 RepID=UPI0027D2FFFC|nr:DNA phosphorothioation-dependent restriction protein DptG [Bacillus cereus]MCU5770251.1 DNA phosphorothioation-dependent restriction protein DptG [Bacillus cereus]HDR7002342.1 DNA phosphorothioation-dependent restriction protein DptG [Bacillus cereus]HDR7017842.1 DNA phosphorothioation-dependent restriction protein DptG [Bacillus cereus]
MYQLDFDKIDKFIDKSGKYTFRRRSVTSVLPLPTREPERVKFDRGFSSITGGIIRKLHGKSLFIETSHGIVEDIISNGKFNDEESKLLFTHYLEEQIKELHLGRVTSLNQLERIPLSENENERKGEIDFINFFFDTFIRNEVVRVQKILQRQDDSDLISEILSLSTSDSAVKNKSIVTYPNFFPNLREQFIKDLDNLASNSSFLVNHISLFFVHYTFIAMSQLILQTNKMTRFCQDKFLPVYYILQWETPAKWRNSYRQGNKMLIGEMDGFFAHEHALNILGMNTISDEEKPNQFYHDIQHQLKEAGFEAERKYIQSIYKWLTEVYEVKTNINVEKYSDDKTLEMAFDDLFSAIKTGISSEINSRYQKSFQTIVSKFFRKHGGSLGTILSLSQEHLLMLVAVSITEDRIELKQLWTELEKRGVWLDFHSKEEVVKVLDKLNYMEKKSDSGDAQYVKSIL